MIKHTFRRGLAALCLIFLAGNVYLVIETKSRSLLLAESNYFDNIETFLPKEQSLLDERGSDVERSTVSDIVRLISTRAEAAHPSTDRLRWFEDVQTSNKTSTTSIIGGRFSFSPITSVRLQEMTADVAFKLPMKTSDSEKYASGCEVPSLAEDSLIRNCITNEVIGRIPDGLKTSAFRIPKRMSPETAEDRRNSFHKVFETRAWGHDWDAQHKGLNASGMGATLQWTQETMAALHILINQLKQRFGLSRVRLLDLPCGDMAWMSRFLKTRDDIEYTGIDIVPELIEHHRKTFSSFPWKFLLQDAVTSPLAESYDLILSRTLLQHLFYSDILRLLGHISASGSRYLLVTSFHLHPENKDLIIDTENPGRFRRINVELQPISLVPPRCLFRDGPPDAFEGWEHFLGLWKLPLRKVRHCSSAASFLLHRTDKKIYSCTNWSLTLE